MITVKELALPEVKLLMPKLHQDDRGYVSEIVHEKQMAELGMPVTFMQENQSMSRKKNTVRGLHSQRPPHTQAKLVRVLRGAIFDVAVDVRPNSKTYGQHVSATLSEDEVTQMFIPAGFLHGFCTLTDNTVVLYKMSSLYAPGSEIGVLWNDPDLKIEWPVDAANAIISGKDEKLLRFKDLPPIDWNV
jgi:dTDP-4-dehydrorhamnose 3,5-epimerase